MNFIEGNLYCHSYNTPTIITTFHTAKIPHNAQKEEQMEGITPILLTLLLHDTTSFSTCQDINTYQKASSGGTVYSASPATLGDVWEKITSGDVILLEPGDYGNFIAGNGMVTISGTQSTTTADTTTVIRPESPKITTGTSTSTNWYGYAIPTGFTDWVTIAAADENNPPHFTSIKIGTIYAQCPSTDEEPDDNLVPSACIDDDGTRENSHTLLFTEDPENDIYLRFAGVVVEDGVSISGARNFAITNSKIMLEGDPRTHMQQGGVSTFNSQNISINCNEITHTAYGVKIAAKDIEVTNNTIHDNAHDGISLNGGTNILIEGNTIHDLDDGISDDSLVCIPGASRDGIYIDGDELVTGTYTIDEDDSSLTVNTDEDTADACPYLDADGGCCTDSTWNMHTDGLQMYTIGWINSKYAEDVTNVTIRGNLIYNYEAMGIMVNSNSVGIYQNFVFENNIFGPAGGYLAIFGASFEERLIFRNNTVLYTPDNTWTSLFGRQKSGQNYYVQTWNSSINLPHYQFYNNILDANSIFGSSYTAGHNVYMGTSSKTPTDSDTILSKESAGLYITAGTIQEQIDAGIKPGNLLSGSTAIDFGIDSINTTAQSRAQTNLGTSMNGVVFQQLTSALDDLEEAGEAVAANSTTAAEIEALSSCTSAEKDILDSLISCAADIETGHSQVANLSQQASSVATPALSLAKARAIIEVNQELLEAKSTASTLSTNASELASSSPNRSDIISLTTAFATNIATLRECITSVRKYTYHVANNRAVLEEEDTDLPDFDRIGTNRIHGTTVDAGAYEYVE